MLHAVLAYFIDVGIFHIYVISIASLNELLQSVNQSSPATMEQSGMVIKRGALLNFRFQYGADELPAELIFAAA